MIFHQPHIEGEELLHHFDFLPDYGWAGYCTLIADCRNDTYLMDIAETYADDFWAYRDKVRREYGFTAVAEKHINGNSFITLQNDSHNVTLIYIPSKANVRIIVEPKRDLPANEVSPYERICKSELVMVGSKKGGSMTFILRLADGRFILVDGGCEHSSADTVLNILKKMAPEPDNITIAAWIITHTHGDHTGAFYGMAERHLGEVKIENLIYNFPCRQQGELPNQCLANSSDNIEKTIAEAYPDVPIYKPHPGWTFHFANLDIEILSTHELHYPPMPAIKNDCCLVMRWVIDGQVIMLPADGSFVSNHTIAHMYGTYLRCDILQADHHGNFGGTTEINTLFSPQTVLYLCPEDDFYNRFQYSDYNICLLNNPNFKEFIVQGDKIIAMPLPYTPGSSYTLGKF